MIRGVRRRSGRCVTSRCASAVVSIGGSLDLFSAWGAFVYRHRRIVALLSVVFALIGFPLAGQAQGVLSSGGWLVRGSESAVVGDRIAEEFGGGRSSLIVLMRKAESLVPSLVPITDAELQAAVEASMAGLRTNAEVSDVITYASAGNDKRFVSNDGMATYALVVLNSTDEESIDLVDDLRADIQPQPQLTYQLTGYGPLAGDANAQSEEDLRNAEIVSLPLALIILLAVFGSVVAAGLPLLVAGLAIPTNMAMIFLVGSQTEMSIYVVNVATMLGLALAIDYSLFLVSRFREELRRGRDVGAAVQIAVGTAGKAVTFSGVAVAIGLLGLLFFTSPAISSIGIAGSLVVLSSVVFGLTVLPAVLGMLGPRVNSLSVRDGFDALRRRLGWTSTADARPRGSRWEGIARWVMSHPILVLVPTLLLLLAAGSPFLRLSQAVPDASVLPPGRESRDAYVALRDEFPGGATSPFEVLANVNGDPFSEANVTAVLSLGDSISRVGQISSVENPFVVSNPVTGEPLPAATVAGLFAHPETLPAEQQQGVARLKERYVSGSTVRLVAHSTADPAKQPGLNVTADLRALPTPAEIASTQVGGYIPGNFDTLNSMRERTPLAVGMTMLVSAIVLFLLFGSIVIPIKEVIMTLLSITASFGALVWIFQEGNLSGLLNFVPLGYTIAGNPIIMFAVIFGLSMDYEVLLLSRVQEAYRRTGDNTASVAEGLARTAAVITGAAMIMVVVFAAFALAQTITIKSIGVGMAIAVFLDATIIRIFLVPATMRLMGKWNWWAPGPLGRLADRLGFSHVEDTPTEAVDAADEPAVTPAPSSA
jgi:RND superfamily putative drug exporter